MSPKSLAGAALASPPLLDFQTLYASEFDYVWNSLRRLGVQQKDLEDLVHDTFLTAYRRLDSYDRDCPLRPWLFGIAFRVVADFRKRVHHSREVSGELVELQDDGRSPHEHAEASQARTLVLRALEALELDRRAVFVMHELDGHPIPHVASVLGVPLNTAYSRLRLARADFARAVAKLREGPEGGTP